MELYTIVSIGAGIIAATIGAVSLFFWWKNRKDDEKTLKTSEMLNITDLLKDKSNAVVLSSDLDANFYGNFISGTLISTGDIINKKNKSAINPIEYGTMTNEVDFLIRPKQHTICFGASGSGKSDTFLIPQIMINACANDGASALVADPKQEIYDKLAPFLKARGKNVYLLNLAEPPYSTRINIFQIIIDYLKNFLNYSFIANFITDKNLLDEVETQKENFKSKALSSATDLAEVLISASSAESSVWTKNAKSLIKTTLQLMIDIKLTEIQDEWKETELYKTCDVPSYVINNKNYEKEKESIFDNAELKNVYNEKFKDFNFKTLNNWISTTEQSDYIKMLNSQGMQHLTQIFQTAPEQYNSFKMNVMAAFEPFLSPDLEKVLCFTDLDFQEFVNGNTYLFVKIPSQDRTKQAIASLLVQQLWNYLENVATNSKGKTLPHPFYFYLEELANIPKIPCLETIITLGRSYKIFGLLVIQSLSSIMSIYGDQQFKTLYDSIMCKIFLRIENITDLEWISKQFGTKEYRNSDGNIVVDSLLTTNELKQNKKGNAYVWYEGGQPISLPLASFTSFEKFHRWEYEKFMKNDFSFSDLTSTNYQNTLQERKEKLFKIITDKEIPRVAKNKIKEEAQRFEKWWNFQLVALYLENLFMSGANDIVAVINEKDALTAAAILNEQLLKDLISPQSQLNNLRMQLMNESAAHPFCFIGDPKKEKDEFAKWKNNFTLTLQNQEYIDGIVLVLKELMKDADICEVVVESKNNAVDLASGSDEPDAAKVEVKLEPVDAVVNSVAEVDVKTETIVNIKEKLDLLTDNLTSKDIRLTEGNYREKMMEMTKNRFYISQLCNIFEALAKLLTNKTSQVEFYGFGKTKKDKLIIPKQNIDWTAFDDATQLYKLYKTIKNKMFSAHFKTYNDYQIKKDPNFVPIKEFKQFPFMLSDEEQVAIRKEIYDEILSKIIKKGQK